MNKYAFIACVAAIVVSAQALAQQASDANPSDEARMRALSDLNADLVARRAGGQPSREAAAAAGPAQKAQKAQ